MYSFFIKLLNKFFIYINYLLHSLSPCSYCEENFGKFKKSSICDDCWSNVLPIIPLIILKRKYEIRIYSLGKYVGLLEHLIKIKYYKSIVYYEEIAFYMSSYFKNNGLKADLLIPVPQHFMRRYNRWFNHSKEISNYISKNLDVPVFDKIYCSKNKNPQAFLPMEERKKYIKDLFFIDEKYKNEILDKEIFIIDDVYTTGETVSAMIEVLVKFKPKSIKVLTIARS